MEEADEILLLALRQAECKIDPGLKSLENVDSATMVASVSRCLKVITEGEATFNESLPPSMAARHRICQGLAQHVKRLGFSGECGFNQLLYPNAKDARKLLMFLVEKLPKEEADGTGEPLDRRALLNRALVSAAKAAATRPWAPHVFSSRTGANPRALDRLPLAHFHSVPLVIPPTRTAAKQAAYFRRHVPAVTAQAPRAPELAASLAEREAVALGLQSAQEKAADAEGGEGDASLRSGSSALTDAGAARVRALLAASLADTTLGLGSDGAAGGGQAGGPGGSGASGSDGDGATLADLVASFRSRGLQGGSDRSTAFANRQHFTQEQSAPSTEVAAALQAAKEAEEKDAAAEEERQNKEIEGLDKRVQAAREQAMELARKRDAAIATVRGLEADVQGAREQSSELEKSYKLKKRVIEMLPEFDKHMADLQRICAATGERLMAHAARWEEHRLPMVEAIRAKKDGVARRRARARAKVVEMKRMRAELRQMASDVREQEERVKLLTAEYEKLPKNVNRAVYTYRIMDIIRQVRKQKAEIGRIIGDIRAMQKQINSTSGKLQRTEAVAEERLYQGASSFKGKDQNVVDAYKEFSRLRDLFESLVETVRGIGRIENERRDVAAKIEQLAARNTRESMAQVAQDLATVREENEQLRKQVAGAH